MKKTLLWIGLLLVVATGQAQDFVPMREVNIYTGPPPAQPNSTDLTPDLTRMTADIKTKLDAGLVGGTNYDDSLQTLKAFIIQHARDGKRDQLARLYLLVAHVYADGLTNTVKARAVWSQVVHDFPGTLAARGAALSLQSHPLTDDPANPSEGLQVGQRFPNFQKQDLNGHELSITAARGKLVLVDFWATWCHPSLVELPNVISTYRKFGGNHFTIIGVNLDHDRSALSAFLAQKGMTWPQYFDGQDWDNALAKQYGVTSIPANYLLDEHGIIIGKDLRGADLPIAVMKALTAN